MTKEQEAIERINRFKTIKVLYGNTFAMTTEQLRALQEDIETALNMLKEKDKEIADLKQALARNIAKNFTSSMKESAKSKDDLEMLNKGWQIELEKKNKQIDLMAEYIVSLDIEEDICVKTGRLNECDSIALGECENCIKQYFKEIAERKSEEC